MTAGRPSGMAETATATANISRNQRSTEAPLTKPWSIICRKAKGKNSVAAEEKASASSQPTSAARNGPISSSGMTRWAPPRAIAAVALTCLTRREAPIYATTVVGPPPQKTPITALQMTLVLEKGIVSGRLKIDLDAVKPDEAGWWSESCAPDCAPTRDYSRQTPSLTGNTERHLSGAK